jgi:uncharacterized protein YecT (DUF1311 family)
MTTQLSHPHRQRGEADFLQKLKAAQRLWIAFRDAHLESLYPAGDKQLEYGSAYGACRCLALVELTNRRLEELKVWLRGVPEGETCKGSVRIRRGDEGVP